MNKLLAIKGAFWELKHAGRIITPAAIVQQSRSGEDGPLFDTDYPQIIEYLEGIIARPESWRNYNYSRAHGYLQLQPIR